MCKYPFVSISESPLFVKSKKGSILAGWILSQREDGGVAPPIKLDFVHSTGTPHSVN